ncbi:hypothetical protein C8R43DRAFT_959795 [Mycena crocata]|nr:hypothetical protein C8R43DRAFT_959795 [Mycena crocata]
MARSKVPPRSRKPTKAIVYNRLRRRYKKWAGLGITDAQILRDGWAWNDLQAAPTDYSGNGWSSNNGWGGGGWSDSDGHWGGGGWGDSDVEAQPGDWSGNGWDDAWDRLHSVPVAGSSTT